MPAPQETAAIRLGPFGGCLRSRARHAGVCPEPSARKGKRKAHIPTASNDLSPSRQIPTHACRQFEPESGSALPVFVTASPRAGIVASEGYLAWLGRAGGIGWPGCDGAGGCVGYGNLPPEAVHFTEGRSARKMPACCWPASASNWTIRLSDSESPTSITRTRSCQRSASGTQRSSVLGASRKNVSFR